MKLSITSDVHLEFGSGTIKNTDKADVLILSGDILVADAFYKKEVDFFRNCLEEFVHVVYIMGNHEHYQGEFNETSSKIRAELSRHFPASFNKYLHFLDNETVEIDGVKFIGGTCWSSMNDGDPLTMLNIKDQMNDFRIIKKGQRHFTPSDATKEHEKFISLVFQELSDDILNVVVGHHPPSKQFIHPRYKDSYHMNGGYVSNLDAFIEDHPEIALWTCGHVHTPKTVMIGETQVVCNPRGYYGLEHNDMEIPLTTVEIKSK